MDSVIERNHGFMGMDSALKDSGLERVDNHVKPKGFELVVATTSDIRSHPHELYISMIANRLDQWARPDWLDLGCGWHFDWPWELEREKKMLGRANVVGLDLDCQAVAKHRTMVKKVVGSIATLPFASGSFDVVTANVVVEHLKYPSLAFSEVFRVLRRDGSFILRTPSARSYFVRIARLLPQGFKVWLATGIIQKRKPEDIYPAHYRANTSAVIEEICKIVGFRRLDVRVTRARGILTRVPALARVERIAASAAGMSEGNLVVEAFK
jgi:ubiquinone/menaquinone biosynthesis C-methylase UbiE